MSHSAKVMLIKLYIHLFSTAYPRPGLRGSMLSKVAQISLSIAPSSISFWGIMTFQGQMEDVHNSYCVFSVFPVVYFQLDMPGTPP